MALPSTHRAQAKSLHKRGLITDKQHERMITRLAAMEPPAPDPALAQAVAPAAAPAVPATASVPAAQGALTKPETGPSA